MEPVSNGSVAASDHARLHATFLPHVELARQRFEGLLPVPSSRYSTLGVWYGFAGNALLITAWPLQISKSASAFLQAIENIQACNRSL